MATSYTEIEINTGGYSKYLVTSNWNNLVSGKLQEMLGMTKDAVLLRVAGCYPWTNYTFLSRQLPRVEGFGQFIH